MVRSLANLVDLWCEAVKVASPLRPTREQIGRCFAGISEACRPGVNSSRLQSWERRFGYPLPESLKVWLRLSDGFYGADGPLIHPLSSLGPMVPFAEIPGLTMQPESWFELGNPNRETVCIDLGYRWPGGDYPLFISGDDEQATRPRLIAPGFTSWFLKVLYRGGAEYWLEPDFAPMGDPWDEHRRQVTLPPLPASLQPYSHQVRELLGRGDDDGSIARKLGISRTEIESIVRHIQHDTSGFAAVGSKSCS